MSVKFSQINYDYVVSTSDVPVTSSVQALKLIFTIFISTAVTTVKNKNYATFGYNINNTFLTELE